jgi:putative redox protein
MKESVNVTWDDKMAFVASVGGHELIIDADPEFGGEHRGPKPKPLLLVSLGGCTGMDVVSILHKMKVRFDRLNIEVEGTLTEEHPKRFTVIVIRYQFVGQDLPMEKIRKAVNLSEERYCGVNATLKNCVEINTEIWLNGQQAL